MGERRYGYVIAVTSRRQWRS